MASLKVSSISPEQLELRLSDFQFLPLGCQKNVNLLFWTLLVTMATILLRVLLTKIIKITNVCSFYPHLY